MGYTDSGSSVSLSQSPLRAPTVFNFFYPSYQFPGVIASAGLTTPEFQLTSDTSVALAMNFLECGILNNSNNTNGLSQLHRRQRGHRPRRRAVDEYKFHRFRNFRRWWIR